LLPIWNFCPFGLLAGTRHHHFPMREKRETQTTTIVHTLLLTKNHQKHKTKNQKTTPHNHKNTKNNHKQQNNTNTHPNTQKNIKQTQTQTQTKKGN